MELKNENIICISDRDWENIYMNPAVELLSEIAKNNNVLYIDRQHTIKDIFLRIFKNKGCFNICRVLGVCKRIRCIETRNAAKLNILSPYPSIPFNWLKYVGKIYRAILRFNAFLLKKNIRKAIRKLKINDPIIINSWNPFVGIFLYGKFNAKLEVYFCWDEMRLAPYYKPFVGVIEDEYVKKVDAVISTSKAIAENRKLLSKNNFVVENAADFNLFNKSYKLKSNQEQKPKVVGYIGSIDYRFDSELVKYLIQNSPDIKFLIVGRNENQEAINMLSRFSNVEIHPSQVPEKLPEFAAKMDIGIIPFRRLEVIRNMYPMKINEYLSAGLPVIMTKFANLPEFDDIVFSTNKADVFLERIREEVKNDSKQKQIQRIDFAKNNSWEKRAEKFAKILSDLLKKAK
ncbi:MAG: glycosyltransferase [Bacteroidales bacterium]|nr:glycosyltransferase [Bacteroidales bacterium]